MEYSAFAPRCIPFVGRVTDFQTFGTLWVDSRICTVHGLRAVGKSYFVREFLRKTECRVLNCDLSCVDCVDSLYTILMTSIENAPLQNLTIKNRWISHFTFRLARYSKDTACVVFLNNAENSFDGLLGDHVFALCTTIVRKCPNVKVVVTSTKKIGFAELGRVYFTYELKPLRHSESKDLLKLVAPDVDFSVYCDAIAELCEGIPLLIVMIGSEMQYQMCKEKGGITPEQGVELLLQSRLKSWSGDCKTKDENMVGKLNARLYVKVMSASPSWAMFFVANKYLPLHIAQWRT